MIYNIYQDVARNLKKVKDIDVYIEDIPQGVKMPLFLIHIYESKYSTGINKRQKTSLSLDVLYFPKSKEELKRECLELVESLYHDFSLDNFKISDRSSTIVDDIAHFTFNISYREYKEDEVNKIERIEAVDSIDKK